MLTMLLWIYPSHVSSQGYKISPVFVSICVWVLQLVITVTAELSDTRIKYLVVGRTLTKSQMSLNQGCGSKANVNPLKNMVFKVK